MTTVNSAPRALCNVSHLPLWAIVSPAGDVIGIENRAREIECGYEPVSVVDRDGNRSVPLYGAPLPNAQRNELLIPSYQVLEDCAIRSIEVRRRVA